MNERKNSNLKEKKTENVESAPVDDVKVDEAKKIEDLSASSVEEEKEEVRIPKDFDVAFTAGLSKELQKMQGQLAQAQADFDNYRKRVARDHAEIRQQAAGKIIEELLPILDNFEIGLKSVSGDKSITSGFQMIFTQIQTILKNNGVVEIMPEHEAFNPEQEEAVAYVADPNVPEGQVVQTVRKGYLLHKKLLRPASVIVSKGSEEK